MVSGDSPVQSVSRVLVGIPTINRPDLVKRTIASVLQQAYGDIEVVVSDNGSDAPIPDELAVYADGLGDPRLRFYRQPSNEGEYGQGRYFLSQMEGHDFFVMLHDDDTLDEDYLAHAVEALDREPSADLYLANPRVIDPDGNHLVTKSEHYLVEHRRDRVPDGVFDVAREFLKSGFTPISGTVFRTSALRQTGFITQDLVGNYPFECDVFLRLADRGTKGVFDSRTLLSFCFHPDSLRNYMNPMNNRTCVERLIALFAQRRYDGICERRRRKLLGRYYRALALLDLREHRGTDAKDSIVRAVRSNPMSIKGWPTLLAIFAAPGLFAGILGPLPEVREAPRVREAREA